MCRQYEEDLRARAEAQLRAEAQQATLTTATAVLHNEELLAVQEQHAAELQTSARYKCQLHQTPQPAPLLFRFAYLSSSLHVKAKPIYTRVSGRNQASIVKVCASV